MKYNTFPTVAEVWTGSIPTIAFELIRLTGTRKRLNHLFTINFRRVISPFVLVWLFQNVSLGLFQNVIFFVHFNAPFLHIEILIFGRQCARLTSPLNVETLCKAISLRPTSHIPD
jgi:hypothetical protein